MPKSYRPHLRKDDEKERSQSQTRNTNTTEGSARVRELLDHKDTQIFSIRAEQTLREAVTVLRDHRIGALLVLDQNGALQGILSERDIVRKLADTPGETLPKQVSEVMTRDVVTCSPDEYLVNVLRRMTEGRFRHMPVLEDGTIKGIVTIGDVVNYRLNQLELEALQIKQLIVG